MPFGLKVRVMGDYELIGSLAELEQKVRNSIVRSAARKAMGPVKKAAIAAAPEDSGALKRNIKKGPSVKTYHGAVSVLVGAIDYKEPYNGSGPKGGRNAGNYAHLVELGHAIVARGSLKTRMSRGRGPKRIIQIKGTGLTMGWVAARPFLKKALQLNESRVKTMIEDGIRKGLEKHFDKLGKGKG